MNRTSDKPVVCIIHPGTLGDVVLSLQALRSIRSKFPNHEVVLVMRSEIGKVLLQWELGDRVLGMEGPILSQLLCDDPHLDHAAAEIFSRCEYAVAWVADRDGQLAESLKKLGVPNRCIMSPHHDSLLAIHQADRYCETLDHWEQEVPGSLLAPSFPLKLPGAFLNEGFLHSPPPLGQEIIMVHYGSGSPHKCMAPERMGAVIRRLTDEGVRKVILCQGPADVDTISELEPYVQQVPVQIMKHTDLLGVVKFFQDVHAFVGHDSGLTHLASAFGVPTLALFGPTDHRRWGPRGAKVEILPGLNCQCLDWKAVQQCSEKMCLAHPIEEIVQAVDRLLTPSPKGAPTGTMPNAQSGVSCLPACGRLC